jgi:uncharacterized protein (DUF1778 family)
MVKEKKEPVTIRIEPSLRGQLQSRADAERRTLSQFIALILERYLEESGKPPGRSPARK